MPLHVVPVRDRALWQVVKGGRVRSLERGARISCGAGGEARCAHVTEGVVALWRGRIVQEVAGAGQLVGLEAIWTRRAGEAPHRGGSGDSGVVAGSEGWLLPELEALTPVRLALLPGHRVLEGVRRGKWTLPLALESLDETARAQAAVRSAGGSAPVALAAVLRRAARAVGTACADGSVRLPPCIPHRIWAAWCGLHRSTVTTLLNDWIFEDRLVQAGRALVLPAQGGLPGEGGAAGEEGRCDVDPVMPPG